MKLLLLAASALTLVPALTFPIHPITRASVDDDLTGTYACQGVKPDGKEYRGTVQIARYNGTYHVRWVFGPREHYAGIGIASGSVLSVSYFGTQPGVVSYQVQQDEKGARLVGQWTMVNADGHVFSETLTRVTRDVADIPMPEAKPKRGRLTPSYWMRSA
jgi:hypothetical protein